MAQLDITKLSPARPHGHHTTVRICLHSTGPTLCAASSRAMSMLGFSAPTPSLVMPQIWPSGFTCRAAWPQGTWPQGAWPQEGAWPQSSPTGSIHYTTTPNNCYTPSDKQKQVGWGQGEGRPSSTQGQGGGRVGGGPAAHKGRVGAGHVNSQRR